MHIIEHYFDVGGFDHRLVQGGISVYLWNLARSFVAAGHRVSIVAPAHGRLADIAQHHDITALDYDDRHTLTIPLDGRVWIGFPPTASIELRTTAHHLALAGVDLYFLSNALLDALPDTFYPPYDAKGRDLVFFKPLAFQADSIRFLRARFGGERTVIHTHEPYYHYLLPAAFAEDPDTTVVSTVQSNMPITKMVYRPEVESLLESLDVKVVLPAPEEPRTRPEQVAIAQYQQRTHLHYEYPPDHVNVYALVAEHADLVDFLSPGQLDFYSTFADTPFERLFRDLPVAETVRRTARKAFVGGCALSDWWLAADPAAVDREQVLGDLGLDPGRVTFFHNARYAVHHKGQLELMRAADRVLGEGLPANFVIRCLSGAGIDDPYFHEVAARHRGAVHLEWAQVPEERLFGYAASADFCVFPSKFEMDTFLIAQGEAMACGAVPIATAQQGMAHFRHVADPLHGPDRETATGFAVPRSFAEDDPLLVDALADRMRTAVRLLHEQPDEYRRLSANAVRTAQAFTWERCARLHLDAITPVHEGRRPVLPDDRALRYGWFDQLSAGAWAHRGDEIAARAIGLGDRAAYARVAPVTEEALRRMAAAAHARADFDGWAGQSDRLAVTDGSEPGTVRLTYRLPHAERVDLVRPSPDGPGRGAAVVYRLEPRDDAFTAQVPAGAATDPLCLVLTLRGARATWDVIRRG